MVKSKRQSVILLISSILGVMTLSLCLYVGKEILRSLTFSVLLGLLTMVCFRWWTNPLYNNIYDYFSPLAIISTFGFVYMGVGNIMPFLDHESMRFGNSGADEYYIPPLFASLIGVILFDVAYRLTSAHQKEREKNHPLSRLGIENLSDFRIKVNAITWYIIGFLVFEYMSAKYVKYGMSYMGVAGEIDNILANAGPGFLYASWCALSLLMFTAKSTYSRWLYGIAALSLMPILFAFSSRNMAIIVVIISGVSYLATRPDRGISSKTVMTIAIALVTLFVLITGVKSAYYRDSSLQAVILSEHNLRGRFTATLDSKVFLNLSAINDQINGDSSYRIAGLDFPAAIEKAHSEQDIPYMLGYHNLVAVTQTIPRIVWPGKFVDEPKSVITDHFGLESIVIDQLPTLIGSAYADGGLWGVLIGMPLLAIILCLMQSWIWGFKEGFILYMASMSYLACYETYLLSNPLMALRFAVIMIAINFIIRSLLTVAPDIPITIRKGSF